MIGPLLLVQLVFIYKGFSEIDQMTEERIMRKKKSVSIVITVFLFLLFPANACALPAGIPAGAPKQPCYQYVDRVTASLSITQGTAAASVKVRDADGDASRISCTMHLQKYSEGSWHNIKRWSQNTKSHRLTMSHTKTVSKGKYRIRAIVKAYKGNTREKIIKYSKTVSY